VSHPTVPVLVRFWLGAAGSVVAGLLAFRAAVFDPSQPTFECVTVGILAAGDFALVRVGYASHALALVVAFSFVRVLLAAPAGRPLGVAAALAGLCTGIGVFIVAVIFHLVADKRIRFGKFLITGPLLAGVYLAIAPLAEFSTMTISDSLRTLLLYLFVGLIIGEGVGLGVEVAELMVAPAVPAHPAGGAAPDDDTLFGDKDSLR
jgi:hypothetical protein